MRTKEEQRKANTEACRRYRKRHPDRNVEASRRYRKKNPDKRKETLRKYYLTHKEEKFSYESEYRQKPKVKKRIRELKRKRNARLYKTDPQYRADSSIRGRIRAALKRYGDNPVKTVYDKLIGCTPYEYKRYLEAQFKPGMTWKNIHIDHIIPSSSFDLLCEKQVRKCFHYTNCQPLFPIDNIRKKNKIL